MTTYGMVIEIGHCIGCNTCVRACKDEYVGNDYPPYSAAQPDTIIGYSRPDIGTIYNPLAFKPGQNWLKKEEVVRGKYPHVKAAYVNEPCMQCADPPCAKAATNGAVYKRADGIVIIDPVKSVGQRQIVAACPYGRIYWNENTNLPQKCTFCAHLVDAGSNPKCVDACPDNLIHFGDLSDPNSAVSKLLASSKAELMHPEYGTKPNVYYLGLPKTFLSGTVASGGTGYYVEGATVTLQDNSGTLSSKLSTNYGDFEFDGLKRKVMYTLLITKSGYLTEKRLVYLNTDTDVGEIKLNPTGV